MNRKTALSTAAVKVGTARAVGSAFAADGGGINPITTGLLELIACQLTAYGSREAER